MIIHLGIADAGHYYSLVKDRKSETWYEFNDTNVKPFDINTLHKEAFGSYHNNQGEFFNKIKNAYLIIYDKMGVSQNDHLVLNHNNRHQC